MQVSAEEGLCALVIDHVCVRLSHYATRATLLATEMMKTRLLYRAAAAAFIKITSEVQTIAICLELLFRLGMVRVGF
jgi:hypothetical protein